jgi:hypothetical protein
MPNGQHQRREPAATEQRMQTELNGWLPSAECCGYALVSSIEVWLVREEKAHRAARALDDPSKRQIGDTNRVEAIAPTMRANNAFSPSTVFLGTHSILCSLDSSFE